MLRFLFSLCLLSAVLNMKAQNLVPNPSLENIGTCPTKHGQSAPLFDSYTQNWYSANVGSPDLFTPCSGLAATTPLNIIPPNIFTGIQVARTGNNFVGIYHYGLAEYLANTLQQPLIAGVNYKISFYVSCADKQKHITDAIGMYISDTQIKIRTGSSNPAITNVIPQIVSTPGVFINNTDWTEISGVYTAKGGEQYITIGCFFDEKASNILSSHIQVLTTAVNPTFGAGEARLYYYIDDVSLTRTLTGPLSVCSGAEKIYSVPVVAGATAYTWTLPNGWTGSSTTDSITVTAGTTGGAITVTANDANNTTQSINVTVDTEIPAKPSAITGDAVLCAAVAKTFSVGTVSGASSYNWTSPTGWAGISNTNSISITPNVTSGTISVKASNSCGSSDANTLDIIVASKPATPGVITGTTPACESQSTTYSIASVTDATYYTWALPTGWSGTSITSSIAVTPGTTAGSIKVSAANGCGTSTQSQLAVTSVSGLPDQPGTINGATALCDQQTETYSISPIANAASYNWTLPSGWNGTSTSESISITAASDGGSVKVTAQNSCGISSEQTISVSFGTPSQPGIISGATDVCPEQNKTYSISPVSGATSYGWSIPSGWSGTSTGETISVLTNDNNGTIKVAAYNSCGASAERTLAVFSHTPIASITKNNGTLTSAPADSYRWVDCDNLYALLLTGYNSFTPSQSGNYSLIVTESTCADTADCVTITLVPTTVSDAFVAEEIEVFPNPANELISVRLKNNRTVSEIALMNYTGAILYKKKATEISSDKTILEIPLSEIKAGIYLLQLTSEDENTISKTISIVR